MQALSATPDPGDLRVLRVCTSFMPSDEVLQGKGRLFDPIGGMQNHTAELTRALDRRALVQTVVTTRPPGAPRTDRIGDGCHVLRLGLPIRKARQLYSLPALRLLPAVAERADLVHVHLGEDLAVLPLAFAAARRRKLPVVMTVHCSLRHTLRAVDLRTALLALVGGRIEGRAEHRADAVIALSSRLADKLTAEGVPPARLHVIPSGVNPALFRGPFERPWPEVGAPRVVFVGRLVRQKGVHVLLEALPHLRSKNATVLFVGEGPERARLEERTRVLGVGDRARITGFVPHDLVPAVLAHADLLVLPSVYEELGSILVEAMQAGLPVVASRTGGIPEAVTHGDNGLLVAPEDPIALAAAIDRVLSDEALARRLARNARARAHRYDWDHLAGQVVDVYRDVIHRRPSARAAIAGGFGDEVREKMRSA